MEESTIGDDVRTKYEFEFPDGSTRTSDELGDFEEAGFDWNLEFFVEHVQDEHPECTVNIIGFEQIEN